MKTIEIHDAEMGIMLQMDAETKEFMLLSDTEEGVESFSSDNPEYAFALYKVLVKAYEMGAFGMDKTKTKKNEEVEKVYV